MSNDQSARRLLPQTSQMGSFTFAPQTFQQPRETQKNYVFVDEHNRHKRLKVMRACEGCRRRKIKCDAATTNTWPCSACIRLKLHCVRPNGFDGAADTQIYEPSQSQFDTGSGQDDFRAALPLQDQPYLGGQKDAPNLYNTSQTNYGDAPAIYHPAQYSAPNLSSQSLAYSSVQPLGPVDHQYSSQSVFPTPPLQQSSRSGSPPEDYSPVDGESQNDLSDLLGSLKVNEAGTAPYLNNKMRALSQEEEPALEDADEYRSVLPPLSSRPGTKIRIPPELMPDEETSLHYFDLYFSNVHPYVPVLDKTQFYQQWQQNRDSLSPLLLEAIFAIAGRLSDEPALGQQWLALATRHADSFMDVPRLSTLQALLILLKAREASPQRGYFFRSWMSIVQCVQLGKDLGLEDHIFDHSTGRPCHLTPPECFLKNRIWQTVFVCETMIGTPQGRMDLAVDLESVDFDVPRPLPGGDEAEYHVSRNFTFFARIVRNIRHMSKIYIRVKRTKDWGIDPEFVQLNPMFESWLHELPGDLIVTYSPDASAPWLPSPFIGNLHSYYYLSIILLHRPQLTFLDPNASDGRWKQHMLLCYNSAKLMCRLQEAVVQSFGLEPLQCMQRGISFTLYAVLSCIVLHLVAITSPDPDLNSDAREYFTRHMRVLEKCMGVWHMPEMQKQVDAVREAFSADIRKPFVLKPTFPYGSPRSGSHPSPPQSGGYRPNLAIGSLGDPLQIKSSQQQAQVSFQGHPISPPTSAGPTEGKNSPAVNQSLAMLAAGQVTQASAMAQVLPMAEAATWNPARIFDQWNSSFGTPQAQAPPTAISHSSPLSIPSSGSSDLPTVDSLQAVPGGLQPDAHSQLTAQQFSAAPVPTFVTPAMWQESVASVYENGLKRSWQYDPNSLSMNKRR